MRYRNYKKEPQRNSELNRAIAEMENSVVYFKACPFEQVEEGSANLKIDQLWLSRLRRRKKKEKKRDLLEPPRVPITASETPKERRHREIERMFEVIVGEEDPLEGEMATHSSILAWKIPRTEEFGGLPFMGLQRVKCD